MVKYDWRQWTRILLIIGTVQYVVLTVLAMIFYPGGIIGDTSIVGYSFTQNFFSDLGRISTPGGESNIVSRILFSTALTVSGILFIPYLITLPGVFTKSRPARILCYIGSAIGIYTAICFVAIAFVPIGGDLTDLHLSLVEMAFAFVPLEALCFAIAMYLEKEFSRLYSYVFFAFTIILFLYLGLLFMGPKLTNPDGSYNPDGLTIQAVGQKIVVYAMNISFAIQAYGAFRVGQRQTPGSST